MNTCNPFYEFYLMSKEDLFSTIHGLDTRYDSSFKNNNNETDNMFHETISWKLRVLHATQLERIEIQNKISMIERNIQTLFNEMMK